ncbi:hypothetical protein MBELCI_1336 [Limimaricola cinnabarinus LL-001]|uniref:Uncharacterized protein n=1 Tax=Limimaricola cinnabarinus LL-001 TaxID=1337093 RepID=U3AC89_9RHOB|nr:hypothetical protein MBELCI_1336 [Limimaricola cinnabarinus LL-001]
MKGATSRSVTPSTPRVMLSVIAPMTNAPLPARFRPAR